MARSHSLRQESSARLSFPFFSCRNISGPDDSTADRKIYAGHAPADSFLDLEDDENVREYLVDRPGKQKHSPTTVHLAMRETLYNTPDLFCVLNGGICIVAKNAEIDEAKKSLLLDSPSIINGSQTQGELKRFFACLRNGKPRPSGSRPEQVPNVKYEIIITNDTDLIADISIARNFQNDVRAISIAGRRGYLDSLEESLKKSYPLAKLRKRESDVSEDYIDTEKLIQVLFALSPPSLWSLTNIDQDMSNKVFTYSQKAKCLKIFQRIAESLGDGKDPATSVQNAPQVHNYFLDMAGTAFRLYEKWKQHPGFRGTRLRSIERDGGEIVDVPDGIVFPILGSLSAFVSFEKGKWQFKMSPSFKDDIIIAAAADDYKEIANSNPQTMGKNKACYSSLLRITTIYASLQK